MLAIIRCARHERTRPIAFGLTWFLLALVPVALIPLAEVENDHRMFFPLVGLALAATWSIALFWIRATSGMQPDAWLRRAAPIALRGRARGVRLGHLAPQRSLAQR